MEQEMTLHRSPVYNFSKNTKAKECMVSINVYMKLKYLFLCVKSIVIFNPTDDQTPNFQTFESGSVSGSVELKTRHAKDPQCELSTDLINQNKNLNS